MIVASAKVNSLKYEYEFSDPNHNVETTVFFDGGEIYRPNSKGKPMAETDAHRECIYALENTKLKSEIERLKKLLNENEN